MEIHPLALKDTWTIEELKILDSYYESNIALCLNLTDEKICNIITAIEENLYLSNFKGSLRLYIAQETMLYTNCIDEESFEYCLRFYTLTKLLHIHYPVLTLSIAFYYYFIDKQKSKEIYEEVFRPRFNIYSYEYFTNIQQYLSIFDENPAERIIELIENSQEMDDECSIDAVNLHILLINNLEITDERYIKYLEKALVLAKFTADQAHIDNEFKWSDTDEERNLCELLCIKFEYYSIKKDYVLAFSVCNELTNAILKSDCVRYYHARDKIYYQMLKQMKSLYPELAFFDDIKNQELELVEQTPNFNNLIDKEITLKNSRDETFNFVVVKVYDDTSITLAPILPSLGRGVYIFTKLLSKNEKPYLMVI